jgi:hypothetical protein
MIDSVVIVSASDDVLDDAAVWESLYKIERRAMKDYEFRVTTPHVQRRGKRLFAMSRSPEFQRSGINCSLAARTLSFMVVSFYEESRRLEVPRTWFHFAQLYTKRRHACLADLSIEESKYPLPGWFGR